MSNLSDADPHGCVYPLGSIPLDESRRTATGAMQLAVAAAPDGHLHLAFVPDGDVEWPVGACVRQRAGDTGDTGQEVVVELFGDVVDAERVVSQVSRILSLDIDATTWPDVGRRDPVIGALQAARPGFRPVNFQSPYECACWLLLTHRSSMAQANAVRSRIVDLLGTSVEVHGELVRAFPDPVTLGSLDATEIAGLSEVKAARLRGVADAAAAGDLLDGARLRSIDPEQAVAELISALDGVGPFTAQGIVLRGAGAPDMLAPAEPRLARAVQDAYRLDTPATPAQVAELADRWRPWRSWVQVLLRAA